MTPVNISKCIIIINIFKFLLNARSVQITGGRMLVQLKRYLRELQLPFQSLNTSRYVQVPSRYQMVSPLPHFSTVLWATCIHFHIFCFW